MLIVREAKDTDAPVIAELYRTLVSDPDIAVAAPKCSEEDLDHRYPALWAKTLRPGLASWRPPRRCDSFLRHAPKGQSLLIVDEL